MIRKSSKGFSVHISDEIRVQRLHEEKETPHVFSYEAKQRKPWQLMLFKSIPRNLLDEAGLMPASDAEPGLGIKEGSLEQDSLFLWVDNEFVVP